MFHSKNLVIQGERSKFWEKKQNLTNLFNFLIIIILQFFIDKINIGSLLNAEEELDYFRNVEFHILKITHNAKLYFRNHMYS